MRRLKINAGGNPRLLCAVIHYACITFLRGSPIAAEVRTDETGDGCECWTVYLKPSINSTGRYREIPSDFSDPVPIGFVSRCAMGETGKNRDTCRAFPTQKRGFT